MLLDPIENLVQARPRGQPLQLGDEVLLQGLAAPPGPALKGGVNIFGTSRTARSACLQLASDPVMFGGINRGAVSVIMYDSYMSELAVSEARNRLAEAIDLARSGEPVYMTRRGRRVAVLVDADSYDALVEAAEDAMDHAELEAARAEDDYVPWEEVKADLGLR